MVREMKPEPLQSLQLVAHSGDSTGNAQVHIFRENFRKYFSHPIISY